MRAVSRLNILLLAGALALAPAQALAQEVPPVGNTQSPDTIGPRDLQNFKLNGTVTRPADRPATVEPSRRGQRAASTAADTSTATATAAPTASPEPIRRRTQAASAESTRPQPREAVQQSAAQAPAADSSSTFAGPTSSAAAQPASTPTFAPDPAATGRLAPERSFPMLPWLLAALALGAAGAFLFWRNRGREAFAGGPQIDAFAAPDPAPVPAPRPAPPAAAPKAAPASLGLVSTRLRPWIEIGFHPLRCVLDDEKVTVEFELELFNSGSAPARAVLAEASLFNAGSAQEQQIAAFFAKPVGAGERIAVMPPLKRITLRSQVFASRDQLQAYELAGRQVFVPVIASNAIYSWSGGDAQTSAAYLLGRDTKGEKMGPFRLDLGPRIFRGIAARLLPLGVRE